MLTPKNRLTSKRPYFLKAWYSWINDNGLTAYIIVNATHPEVKVPRDYIQDGRITLNISSDAVDALKITHRLLEFSADFDEPVNEAFISIPLPAIVAIYAYENGQGTLFPEEEKSENNHPNITLVE